MLLSRITARLSRKFVTQNRSSALLVGRHESKDLHTLPLENYIIWPRGQTDKAGAAQALFTHHSSLNTLAGQWFRFSSSASPQTDEKEAAQSTNGQGKKGEKEAAQSTNGQGKKGDKEASVEALKETEDSISNESADSVSEIDLSRDDLLKLVVEKEQLLLTKQEEYERMKDKVLRTLAEMENVKERTRRESDNAKKFAIQNFAKSLLDVSDNLARASSTAKETFSKVDTSKDTAGAVQQLKVLLAGVEMTEKLLIEVFKKYGLEKYDPVDEEFDPNRHNAVFQVPSASKPAGRVVAVLKAGYLLHDRVIRPAEVGVTVASETEAAEKQD